jgi:hypothetical protein
MRDGVYDTKVVMNANGDLAGRRAGNSMDKRLRVLEGCARGYIRARINGRLRAEYENGVKTHRNDVIEAFLTAVVDRGVFVDRSTLRSSEF